MVLASEGDRRRLLGPPPGDAARRTVPREAVEDLLLLSGCLDEVREERRASAMPAVREVLDAMPGEPFDPVEVVNGMIAAGLRGDSAFWRARYVATGRRLVSALCGGGGHGPPDMTDLPPQRFRVEIQRTFDLSRAPVRRLRLPLPLEGPHLTDLEVKVGAGGLEVRLTPGRMEALVAGPGQDAVTLSAQAAFVARPVSPYGLEAGPVPSEAWLAPVEGPIRVTPAVAALADQLAGARRDPFDAVMAFRDHLLDAMACGRVYADALEGEAATDWVLAHRWYDCRLGSALLAALCRARGIPARLVGGYLLWEAPSEHYWMEAWIPDRGWTPFDLLAWDLSAGGRDRDWRGVYAGALDYRLTTQQFPQVFTGPPGPSMRGPWHRLSRMTAGGTETRLISIPDGALIYAERLSVVRA